MSYLSAEQILFIHARLIDETGGSQGLRDMDGLLAAVGRPRSSFDGKELYPNPFSKAAALFESLIRNHPFVDGNKRTGAAAAGLFLQRNGYELTATSDDLVDIAMGVAQSQHTVEQIASWLRDHSKATK